MEEFDEEMVGRGGTGLWEAARSKGGVAFLKKGWAKTLEKEAPVRIRGHKTLRQLPKPQAGRVESREGNISTYLLPRPPTCSPSFLLATLPGKAEGSGSLGKVASEVSLRGTKQG